MSVLNTLGLVKISDLLIIDPELVKQVDVANHDATLELERAETLRQEAETKLKNAAGRKAEAERRLNAVKAFRQALGETAKKGV